MTRRDVLWVVSTKGQWEVKREGEENSLGVFPTKEAALGQVKIQREDTTIEEEFTYGGDPRRIPG